MKSHERIQDKRQKKDIILFDIDQNPARNFTIILKDLESFAKENNIPVIEVIDAIIIDLENLDKIDYEKKLKHFTFKNIGRQLKKDLINYLKKVKNNYEKKDKQNKKNKDRQAIQNRWDEIEKEIDKAFLKGEANGINEIERIELDIGENSELSSKEKKSILKKLAERKKKIESTEVAREKAKQTMKEIQEIIDREFAEGNINSKAKYLETITREIKNTDKIEGEAKEYLLEMISGKKKEEIYYEQVEHFTNGFEFLSEYPELMNAVSGHKKRKFTDREAYDRFCSLRKTVQCGINEYLQVSKLLEDKSVNDTDKRILEARKSIMDKEIARKREIEGR